MTRRRIVNIIKKEWRLLLTDLNTALLVTLVPLIIVVQGLFYVWLAWKFGGEKMLASPIFGSAVDTLVRHTPALGQASGDLRLLVLLLTQFNFFLLLIPTMIAISIATFSIVDEKVTGSLEALLATPVRTWELLLGKALAGAIPAIVMTWLYAVISLLIMRLVGWGDAASIVANANWYLMFFLVTPALAMLSFMLGVAGSSRAKDARSAQNLVLVIIFPVFALIGIQVTGVIWFTPLLTIVLALVIAAADVLTLRVTVRLFRRESILTQWR